MPTKHIDNDTWSSIEALTIKAINLSGKLVKETDMIRLLVKKGADAVTEEELRNVNGFSPKYGVLSWQRNGMITAHETVHPEEYAAFFNANCPFMTYVYGLTCTGKSNFKDRLLTFLPEETAKSLKVIDEDDGRVTEYLRKDLFETSFKDNKPVILVEHGRGIPEVMTRLVGPMATCAIDFVFAGQPADKGKLTRQ